jgi:hypothetical protein
VKGCFEKNSSKAALILTDKDAVERVLDALNQKNDNSQN